MNGRLLFAVTHENLDGWVVTEALFDGVVDEIGVVAKGTLDVGVVDDGPQQVADEMSSGLVARDEQEHELRACLDVGQSAAVDFRVDEASDEVVLR